MALYTYWCPRCDSRAEVVQSIKSYCEAPEVPDCSGCNLRMERFFTAPLISFDIAPWGAFTSPIDGEVIDSRRKQNEHMARHGVVPFDEIAPDIERNRKVIQQEAKKGLKEAVVEATRAVKQGYKPQVESIDNIIPTR